MLKIFLKWDDIVFYILLKDIYKEVNEIEGKNK